MLAIAIESGNKDFLDTTLAGLVSYNFIYSITVLDKSRDIVAFVINDDFSEMEVDNLRSKEVPIFSTNPNSKKHITKSRHIDHQEQVGSLLISSTNIPGNKRTYSPLESAFLLSVLFAVVTAAIIFFVTRSIKQNVSHMVLSAKRLAEGENGIRLSEDSRITEVWEFSKSFRTAGAFEQEFTVSPFILFKSISYVRNKTTSSAELRGCQLIEKAIYFFLTVCFGSNAPASPI